jgi:hypothetical protein
MSNENILGIAREMAGALARAGYSKDPDDWREVRRLQTALCAEVRSEEKAAGESAERSMLREQIRQHILDFFGEPPPAQLLPTEKPLSSGK